MGERWHVFHITASPEQTGDLLWRVTYAPLRPSLPPGRLAAGLAAFWVAEVRGDARQ
jgi:hypothetical protein